MIRLVTDARGRLEIDFDDRSEDGFVRVAEYLEAQLDARRVGQMEGPGQAWWDYRVDGVRLTLRHDDIMGNTLTHVRERGRATIDRLFPVISAALSG